MAKIDGTIGIDTITGSADADEIFAMAGNDKVRGGTGNDVLWGGDGNDNMNGEVGDDILYGEEGTDTLTGDAGNDTLWGGNGNDGFFGGGGNDSINGEAGDDNMFGDSGNDTFTGGSGANKAQGMLGNDTYVVTVGEGTHTFTGNTGIDTIEVRMTSGQVTDAVRSDFEAYKTYMDGLLASAGSITAMGTLETTSSFAFTSLGITLSATEQIKISVDGVSVPLEQFLNKAPVADAAVSVTVDEDAPLNGTIAATDANGDALGFAVTQGPANGTLTLNATTGEYAYSANTNYSGADTFKVAVSDGKGSSVMQTVNVGVNAVADQPVLSVTSSTVHILASTLTGSTGADVLAGSSGETHILGSAGNDTITSGGPGMATAALSIAAALTDTDGSESLSIVISGVPAGGMLSAGTQNSDGTWNLTPADLAGLTVTASSTADFTLNVTAKSTEQSGPSASFSQDLQVKFEHEAANALIEGGSGNDTITADDRGATIYGNGKPVGPVNPNYVPKAADNDIITGGKGNDTIYGQSGDDVISGGSGNDYMSGGKGNDTITAGSGVDEIHGNSGNDTIVTGSGTGSLRGESGNDTFAVAGEGSYDIHGGSGYDTLDFSLASSAISVDLSKGTAQGAGSITFKSIDALTGTSFNDTIMGSTKTNTINGGAGDDMIRSKAGADVLTGGDGFDTFAYLKKDVWNGTASQGVDRITDFSKGDTLDLRDFFKGQAGKSVSDLVATKDDGQNTHVYAKVGGTMHEVAVLENFHGGSAADMASFGMILT